MGKFGCYIIMDVDIVSMGSKRRIEVKLHFLKALEKRS